MLNGGGIPNLEIIQTEVTNILDGRADQIRDFLGKLDTFTARAEQAARRHHPRHRFHQRLLSIVANRTDTLDRVLTEFPPLIKHFADTRDTVRRRGDGAGPGQQGDRRRAVAARGQPRTRTCSCCSGRSNSSAKASPYLVGALKLMLTAPFNIENVPKVVRGDYINISVDDRPHAELRSTTAFLTGTGFSGALRALEQSWGRDPATMIPDVRFTPNPNTLPGGPLVERGE